MTRFTFIEDGREDMGLLKNAARRFEVRAGETRLGHVVEERRGWRPILLTGERAEFVLPSRRQCAEWLQQASRNA